MVSRRLVLAGGLVPGNVGEAIAALSPYAVDVSSGVEFADAPGLKDPYPSVGRRLADEIEATAISGDSRFGPYGGRFAPRR